MGVSVKLSRNSLFFITMRCPQKNVLLKHHDICSARPLLNVHLVNCPYPLMLQHTSKRLYQQKRYSYIF